MASSFSRELKCSLNAGAEDLATPNRNFFGRRGSGYLKAKWPQGTSLTGHTRVI